MIKTKLKECSVCHDIVVLWTSSPKMCKDCSQRVKLSEKPVYKSLTQTASGLPAKPIKPISDKQAKRLAKYRVARDEYFKDHPVCQYPGCSSTDITLHHGAGKIGSLLWNKKYFKSLCWPHHRIVEGSPLEAKILQLSFDRLDK